MNTLNFNEYCIHHLSRLHPSFQFLTIHKYTNNFNELSDFSVGFHASYHNAVLKSKKILKDFKPSFQFCEGKDFSIWDLKQAHEELLNSLEMSLLGENSLYTNKDTYDRIPDINGKNIPGVKLHRKQQILHLEGFRLQKKIYRPGTYPPDHRYKLTKAKDALRALCPVGRWGQWKLTPEKFEKFVVEKMTVRNKV